LLAKQRDDESHSWYFMLKSSQKIVKENIGGKHAGVFIGKKMLIFGCLMEF